MTIHRYTIRENNEGYITVNEDELMSVDSLEDFIVSLIEDRLWGEMSWYRARQNEARKNGGTIWISLGSWCDWHTHLPPKAHKKYMANWSRNHKARKTEGCVIYTCVY